MVDLHCHTNISDNSMSITEVIGLAKRNGVTHLAITDHDTTKGLPEAEKIGRAMGIEIIPGIEISAYDFKRNKRVHILGLLIEQDTPYLAELCGPLVERRQQAAKEMVRRIIGAGYNITWNQAARFAEGGTGVYKQHIMHALMERGYCDAIYGDLYRKLFSRGKVGAEPGLAYIPVEYIDAVSAVKAVKQAGGIPVLAHPALFDNFDMLPELVAAGLEGIEVRHPHHSDADEIRTAEFAALWDLVKTGGSDFHGLYGETTDTIGSKSLGRSSVDKLYQRQKGLIK